MMDLSELKFRKEKPDAYAGMLNQAHKRPFSPGASTVATTIIAREEEILTSVTATAVEVGAHCVNERSLISHINRDGPLAIGPSTTHQRSIPLKKRSLGEHFHLLRPPISSNQLVLKPVVTVGSKSMNDSAPSFGVATSNTKSLNNQSVSFEDRRQSGVPLNLRRRKLISTDDLVDGGTEHDDKNGNVLLGSNPHQTKTTIQADQCVVERRTNVLPRASSSDRHSESSLFPQQYSCHNNDGLYFGKILSPNMPQHKQFATFMPPCDNFLNGEHGDQHICDNYSEQRHTLPLWETFPSLTLPLTMGEEDTEAGCRENNNECHREQCPQQFATFMPPTVNDLSSSEDDHWPLSPIVTVEASTNSKRKISSSDHEDVDSKKIPDAPKSRMKNTTIHDGIAKQQPQSPIQKNHVCINISNLKRELADHNCDLPPRKIKLRLTCSSNRDAVRAATAKRKVKIWEKSNPHGNDNSMDNPTTEATFAAAAAPRRQPAIMSESPVSVPSDDFILHGRVIETSALIEPDAKKLIEPQKFQSSAIQRKHQSFDTFEPEFSLKKTFAEQQSKKKEAKSSTKKISRVKPKRANDKAIKKAAKTHQPREREQRFRTTIDDDSHLDGMCSTSSDSVTSSSLSSSSSSSYSLSSNNSRSFSPSSHSNLFSDEQKQPFLKQHDTKENLIEEKGNTPSSPSSSYLSPIDGSLTNFELKQSTPKKRRRKVPRKHCQIFGSSSSLSGDSDFSVEDTSLSHFIQKQQTFDDSVKQVKMEKKRENAPTEAEIKRILREDSAAFDKSTCNNWVRRSSRQPSKSVLKSAGVRDLLDKLKNNASDMVVLKLKKYLNDPDIAPVVMNATLDSLEDNTNCQALYCQNFNKAMLDAQLMHLLRILQSPKCRIWCLNIGETYNVTRRTWKKFAKGLKHTKVTHMYTSEHTITPELKLRFRATIRDNRKKHDMHINPENLDVIVRCTHCWWNPINAKVLQPFIKNSWYEQVLFNKTILGLKGTTEDRNIDTI